MKIINKEHKNIFFLVFFIITTLLFSLIISNYYRKKEFKKDVYFVVSQVEITPALRCHFYDKEGLKLKLNSYTFFSNLRIKPGDIIVKKKESNELVVYRTDSLSGKEKIYLVLQPD